LTLKVTAETAIAERGKSVGETGVKPRVRQKGLATPQPGQRLDGEHDQEDDD
jgi:hypothetical protein